MNAPATSVNAWIFLEEDDPTGTSYNTPGSSYQNLVQYGVYRSTDFVSICWVNTLPTSSSTVPTGDGSTYTIELQQSTHPDGSTNQEYMTWVMRDARAANPNVKILVMLGYGRDELTQIFSRDPNQWQQNATDYANNVVAYLQYYGVDGFDVDWEPSFSDSGTPQQFSLVFRAIRAAMDATGKTYSLVLSPSEVGTLDASTVNDCFDFVNLQIYGGAYPPDFTQAGVAQELLAYGAKFEPNGGVPHQNAQEAYADYVAGNYKVVTMWRLNSNDFPFEQAQQMILYQLVYGAPAVFDDAPIIGAAGNPLITSMLVRAGDVLDAIQTTSTGTIAAIPGQAFVYTLPQHGGNGGQANTVTIAANDAVVSVSGYTGIWFGWNCVLQVTITTRSGKVFGPFGSMAHASGQTPFTYSAPSGQSILAFNGTVIDVPVAGGGTTQIIGTLGCIYG